MWAGIEQGDKVSDVVSDDPLYASPEIHCTVDLGEDCTVNETMPEKCPPPPVKGKKKSSLKRIIIDSDDEDETRRAVSSYGRVLKSVKNEK